MQFDVNKQTAAKFFEQMASDYLAMLPMSARPGTKALAEQCLSMLVSEPAAAVPAAPPGEAL